MLSHYFDPSTLAANREETKRKKKEEMGRGRREGGKEEGVCDPKRVMKFGQRRGGGKRGRQQQAVLHSLNYTLSIPPSLPPSLPSSLPRRGLAQGEGGAKGGEEAQGHGVAVQRMNDMEGGREGGREGGQEERGEEAIVGMYKKCKGTKPSSAIACRVRRERTLRQIMNWQPHARSGRPAAALDQNRASPLF